jgi:hypothetical protein
LNRNPVNHECDGGQRYDGTRGPNGSSNPSEASRKVTDTADNVSMRQSDADQ